MFVTGGENNSTGFSNAEYDELIADAAKEPDADKAHARCCEQAERILMDEMPIIPIYFYVSRNLVRPHVRGFYNNLQDDHPLRTIWIDRTVDPNDPASERVHGEAAMIWFVVRRLIGMVFTLWVVFTVSFSLMRPCPAGRFPASGNSSRRSKRISSGAYNLDLPLYEQYWNQLSGRAPRRLGPVLSAGRLHRERSHRAGPADFGGARRPGAGVCHSAGLAAGIVSAVYRGTIADVLLMTAATSASRCRAS